VILLASFTVQISSTLKTVVIEERKDEVYPAGFRFGDGFFPVGRVWLIATQSRSVERQESFLVK